MYMYLYFIYRNFNGTLINYVFEYLDFNANNDRLLP